MNFFNIVSKRYIIILSILFLVSSVVLFIKEEYFIGTYNLAAAIALFWIIKNK